MLGHLVNIDRDAALAGRRVVDDRTDDALAVADKLLVSAVGGLLLYSFLKGELHLLYVGSINRFKVIAHRDDVVP
jgi:hypothetical protein